MHSPLALQAFETAREFRHLGGLRVRINERPEITAFVIPLVRLVEHSSQRHVPALHGFRVRLGQLLTERIGLPKHAGRVLERLLRLDGAVRDNLRDFVFAVLFGDVANHFPAPTLVKVDIEVRLRLTFRIEEALKVQLMRDGIEIGDPHRIGGHGPCT